MRKLKAILVGCFFVTGCNGASPYPPEVVQNFMSACMAQPGATDAACSCVIDRIQQEMSLEEFTQLEAEIAAGGNPSEFDSIIAECASG